MAWEVHNLLTEIHVMPDEDVKPHQTHANCWCQPEIDHEASAHNMHTNVVIYVHSAGDGREQYEGLQ